MCKFFPVEEILDFDLRGNNLQAPGCYIEVAELLPGNEHNQDFCRLKILQRYQMTDECSTHTHQAETSIVLMKTQMKELNVNYCMPLKYPNLFSDKITQETKSILKPMTIFC